MKLVCIGTMPWKLQIKRTVICLKIFKKDMIGIFKKLGFKINIEIGLAKCNILDATLNTYLQMSISPIEKKSEH